ncbi:hypothetical protein JCM10908_006612 [Rhodotorula pacifica]|uniref:uncharacterized protein n=1 Tax=Rhodotorula pacifica TaxID=1495444 RepID=UPI0031753D2B
MERFAEDFEKMTLSGPFGWPVHRLFRCLSSSSTPHRTLDLRAQPPPVPTRLPRAPGAAQSQDRSHGTSASMNQLRHLDVANPYQHQHSATFSAPPSTAPARTSASYLHQTDLPASGYIPPQLSVAARDVSSMPPALFVDSEFVPQYLDPRAINPASRSSTCPAAPDYNTQLYPLMAPTQHAPTHAAPLGFAPSHSSLDTRFFPSMARYAPSGVYIPQAVNPRYSGMTSAQEQPRPPPRQLFEPMSEQNPEDWPEDRWHR